MSDPAIRTRAATLLRAPPREGRPGNAVVWAVTLALAAWVALLAPPWAPIGPLVEFIVPGALAIATWRVSRFAACYLAQIATFFAVTPWILDEHPSFAATSTTVSWSLAIAAGTYSAVAVSRERPASVRAMSAPNWLHCAAVAGLIGVQAYLALTNKVGYAAQINLGRTTPTGLLGTLSTAGPTLTLALLFTCLRTHRLQLPALLLTLAQTGILITFGLRGAPVAFILAVFVGGAVTLPRHSAWRRPTTVLLVAIIGLVLAATTFVLTAVVKSEAAASAGFSSEGTQRVEAATAVEDIARRLDMGSELEAGLARRDVEYARDAIALRDQLLAGVPRALWPEKPDADYGQRVAAAYYGLTSGRTSSSITIIGDSTLNFGAAMPIAAWLVGLALCLCERRLRASGGVAAMVATAVLATRMMSLEQPLILTAVGIVREFLVTLVIWQVCTLLGLKRSTSERR